jgi:hypothetical protein
MATPTYTPSFPGPYSVYLPTTEASQSLLVGFSRNPKTFRVSKYTQYVNVQKMFGAYRYWTSQQSVRILTSNDNDHLWNPGAAVPGGSQNTESTTVYNYYAQRRLFNVVLDDIIIEQADWPILAAHSSQQAELAMTSRTLRVYNQLKLPTQTSAGWGSNTAAVNGGILPSGQTWANGTPDAVYSGTTYTTGPNIKVSFQYGQYQILLSTYGAVDPQNLSVVFGPQLAQAMAASAEIQNYLKQSEFSLAQLRGDSPAQNGQWGLPDILYDTKIEVEKSIRISSRQDAATTVSSSIFPKTEAYMIAREGQLEGIEGARNYSTFQLFFYRDEMTLKNTNDPINERQLLGVVTNDAPVVVAPVSGFQYTACQ